MNEYRPQAVEEYHVHLPLNVVSAEMEERGVTPGGGGEVMGGPKAHEASIQMSCNVTENSHFSGDVLRMFRGNWGKLNSSWSTHNSGVCYYNLNVSS